MFHRKILKSDDGVVGIVVAVLLIGLMISVVSLVQVFYVPKWMEEREAEHMTEVASQFAELKFAIDTQTATQQKYTPIASPITLGSKELPFLLSVRSFGMLEILPNALTIRIDNNDSGLQINKSLGIIKYQSANGYFIDQTYIYESGALITSQRDGDILSVKPSFHFETAQQMNFTLVNITPVGGKVSSGSGYGTTSILTEFHDSTSLNTIINVTFINITTTYTNSWYLFMNWTLKNLLTYGGSQQYTIDIVDNTVIIQFINILPTIKYKIVEIIGQIGPGWIE